eukprot:Tbor_TRINITY_DN4694_c0_g1::TRINITY_DN4694_c0_g1_i1::g.14948::m.14948/K10357/MYO5; myosin V
MTAEVQYAKGEQVFFNHSEHSWVVATIEDISDKGLYTCKVNDSLRTETKSGEIVPNVKVDRIAHCEADSLNDEVDDLLNLTVLHDSTLLRCLYRRYMKDVIYTNIGAIVVALNPFNFNIPRYLDSEMPKYLVEGPVIQHNLPHSWAQAHNTYFEMINDREDQCVLISGESGAGKTEATKIVMKYLGNISCSNGSEQEKAAGMLVGTKLASCSPILEAFGNAKTVRNDNSSRFGKFVKVKFDSNGHLVGAHTTKYLLEKSRIITASKGERIYHSFYVVTRGKLKDVLHLEADSKYKSMGVGGVMNNKEFDTAEDFEEIYNSMVGLGMSKEDINSVWTIPAGVLSLQNIVFLPYNDGCAIDNDGSRYLGHASSIWKVDESTFKHELLTTTRILPGNQEATNPNTIIQGEDIRNAVCKAMYDGVFGWLVDKCNDLCDVENSGNWIGLLDIFGFEDFQHNSFEQICINLTNETIQNHYNSYIFTRDMEECKTEGIDVTAIVCPDNEPCMKMITGQGGILPLLDEQCSVGGIDAILDAKVFTEKVIEKFKSNPFFSAPKMSGLEFTIHHYAGSVKYDTNGWVDKNRDTLKDNIKLLIRSSPDPIVNILLPAPIPVEKKKDRALTVGGFFKNQLTALMALINSTNPHWIRCVKPHPAKKPLLVDGVQTMKQLESSGVLGTVKIRKAGYPVRIVHQRFVNKFRVLGGGGMELKDAIADILKNADIQIPQKAQIGHTKVFLKAEAYILLEKAREKASEEHARIIRERMVGFHSRSLLFDMYIEKYRASFEQELKAKRAKEEAERAERERKEREEYEREKAIKEAKEREIREKEIREKTLRYDSAVLIQKVVRGVLCRNKIYRKVMEEMRANFESTREALCCKQRIAAHAVDDVCRYSEKKWIDFLNVADELSHIEDKNKRHTAEKEMQKYRKHQREIGNKENMARHAIIQEEIHESETIMAKCYIIAKHKTELERKMSLNRNTNKRTHILPPSPALKKQTASVFDTRLNDTLAQYAVSRAKACDSYYSRGAIRGETATIAFGPQDTSTSTKKRDYSTHAILSGRTSKNSFFDKSKNRWAIREDYMDSQSQNGRPFRHDPITTAIHTNQDNSFSEPYRSHMAITSAYPTMQRSPTTSSTYLAPGNPSHNIALSPHFHASPLQEKSRTPRGGNSNYSNVDVNLWHNVFD